MSDLAFWASMAVVAFGTSIRAHGGGRMHKARTITARKDGYRTVTREIFGGWDYHVDLELARE